MTHLIKIVVVLLVSVSVCFADVNIPLNGPTGSTAPVLSPLVTEATITRYVDITAPGVYEGSSNNNTYFTLQNDITADQTGLQFGGFWSGGMTGSIVDLNGYTITFDAVPTAGFPLSAVRPYGIYAKQSSNMVIKNGTILQHASGTTLTARGIVIGSGIEIIDVNIVVNSKGSIGIEGRGAGGRIHGCYVQNTSIEFDSQIEYPIGIDLYLSTNYNVYNNLVVGSHHGIMCRSLGENPYAAGHNIHHNKMFATKRVIGLKTPASIQLYGANECNVYENVCITKDAKGFVNQNDSDDSTVYNNTFDARYTRVSNTTTAPHQNAFHENDVNGMWIRRGDRMNVYDNRMIAKNYTADAGDNMTRAIYVTNGALTTTRIDSAEFSDNSFIALPAIGAVQEVTGMYVNGCDLTDVFDGNYSYGRGYSLFPDTKGPFTITNNYWLTISGEAGYVAVNDTENLTGSTYTGNTETNILNDSVTPAAPTGLSYTETFRAIELTWSHNSELDIHGYIVYRDGVQLKYLIEDVSGYESIDQIVGWNYYADVGTLTAPTGIYTVKAVDYFGNISPASVGLDVGTPGTPVVTMPDNFTAYGTTSYQGSFTVATGRNAVTVISSNGYTVTCDDGDCTDEESETFTVTGVEPTITDTITVTDTDEVSGYGSVTITLIDNPEEGDSNTTISNSGTASLIGLVGNTIISKEDVVIEVISNTLKALLVAGILLYIHRRFQWDQR